MALRTDRRQITTTGTAGSATGSGTSEPVHGRIIAFKVTRESGAPDTTTITGIESGGLGRTVLTLTLSAATTLVYPVVQSTSNAGVAVSDVYEKYLITGQAITYSVAVSNAAAPAVTVQMIWETSPS